MTQSPPTGELVARLRFDAAAWSGVKDGDTPVTFWPLAQRKLGAQLSDAADAITTLERELEEERAALYLTRNERDNARDHIADVSASFNASQAEVERLKEALKSIAEQPEQYDDGTRSYGVGYALHLAKTRARAALQVEESKG